MARGNRDLSSNDYDSYLASKAGESRGARQELQQRKADRRNANDKDGIGYHFGLGDQVVKVESREHFDKVLNDHGLMKEVDVKKDLKGPGKHEFKREKR